MLLVAVGFLVEAAESQPWKRVGVQRTLPRKKQTRFLKGCSSKELSSFSVKKIEDIALRHENILWKPLSLILGDPVASFEAQLWLLTLAWPSLTTFVAPLVAVTAYESLVGLASPLLPLLFQETHRVTGLGLGWDLGCPLWVCSRGYRPPFEAGELDSQRLSLWNLGFVSSDLGKSQSLCLNTYFLPHAQQFFLLGLQLHIS